VNNVLTWASDGNSDGSAACARVRGRVQLARGVFVSASHDAHVGGARAHAGAARALLREILVAPIRFTPFQVGARRGYRFEGEASIAGPAARAHRPARASNITWRPRTDLNRRPRA